MAINVHLGTIVGSKIIENMDSENTTRMLSAELSSADDVQSIELISQNGEQTNPLDDATVIILEINKAWKIAVAIKDLVEPDNTLERGEKKIYAVDSSNNVVAWVYFKGDGNILIENDNGSINIDENGNIIFTTSLKVLLGSSSATEAILKGTSFISALNTFVTAIGTVVNAIVVPTGIDAISKTTFATAVTTFQTALSSVLSTKGFIE